ncbi:MAG: DUF6776 family protein [Castellaniella sp.]|uniref:DUF6776 family protein n=1 Tax=Castellaniella sp. TaxID=1955812 RepID=UPI003C75EEC5
MTRDTERSGGFRRWLIRSLTLCLALALAFIAGAAAMHLGMHGEDRQKIQDLQDRLAVAQAESTRDGMALAAARSNEEVQAGTQRVLQDRLTELQQQLGRVQDQLAFYEQLIPSGPAGAVAIRAFDIQADGEFIRYRALLTRNAAPNADPFKGRMRFVAQGRLQGKPVKIDLNPPQALDSGAEAAAGAVGPLALMFDQFQRSAGVLQVPDGLAIQSVRLEILEGDTIRATQDAVLNGTASVVQESSP